MCLNQVNHWIVIQVVFLCCFRPFRRHSSRCIVVVVVVSLLLYVVRSRKVTLYKFSPNDIELNEYKSTNVSSLASKFPSSKLSLNRMTNVKWRRYYDTILCIRFSSSFQLLYWNCKSQTVVALLHSHTNSNFISLSLSGCFLPRSVAMLYKCMYVIWNHFRTKNLYFVVKSLRLLNAFKKWFLDFWRERKREKRENIIEEKENRQNKDQLWQIENVFRSFVSVWTQREWRRLAQQRDHI